MDLNRAACPSETGWPRLLETIWKESFGLISRGKGKEDAVKRKRYLVEQIVTGLKETETAGPFADLIHHLGIAEQTFYRRKRRYVGMESEQGRQFK